MSGAATAMTNIQRAAARGRPEPQEVGAGGEAPQQFFARIPSEVMLSRRQVTVERLRHKPPRGIEDLHLRDRGPRGR